MFGFCPLFTPMLLSRRAGSDVDATTAADPDAEATSLPCQRRAKQKKVPLPSRKKSRRGERIADGSGGERERPWEGAVASNVSHCLPWIVLSKISTERERISVEIGGLGGPSFSNINNWKTSYMVSLPLRREVPTASLDFLLTTWTDVSLRGVPGRIPLCVNWEAEGHSLQRTQVQWILCPSEQGNSPLRAQRLQQHLHALLIKFIKHEPPNKPVEAHVCQPDLHKYSN